MNLKFSLILITTILIFTNCKSQEKFEINEDKYSSILLIDKNDTSFEVKRDFDNLNLKGNVKPSLKNIFSRFFDKTNVNEIIFYLKKNSNNKYVFEQFIFINKNESVHIHNGNEDIYEVYLNDFEIDIQLCENCLDDIIFTVYRKK